MPDYGNAALDALMGISQATQDQKTQKALIQQYGDIGGTDTGQKAVANNLSNAQTRAEQLHGVIMALSKLAPAQEAAPAADAPATASQGNVASSDLPNIPGTTVDAPSTNVLSNAAQAPATDMTSEQLAAKAPPQPDVQDLTPDHLDALHNGITQLHATNQDIAANSDHPSHSDAAAGDYRGSIFDAVADNLRGSGINLDKSTIAGLRQKYVAGDPDVANALASYGAPLTNQYNALLSVKGADGSVRAYKNGEPLQPGDQVVPTSSINVDQTNQTRTAIAGDTNTTKSTIASEKIDATSALADKNNAVKLQIAAQRGQVLTPEEADTAAQLYQTTGNAKFLTAKTLPAILDSMRRSGASAEDIGRAAQAGAANQRSLNTLASQLEMNTPNSAGGQIVNAGTAFEHLADASALFQGLQNGDNKSLNTIANKIKAWNGSPIQPSFDVAKTLAVNEVLKAASGGVLTGSERDAFQKELSQASSPQAAQQVVDTLQSLLSQRVQSQYQSYQGTPSEGRFLSKLRPSLRTYLGLPDKPAASAPEAAPATASTGSYKPVGKIGGYRVPSLTPSAPAASGAQAQPKPPVF